jgi:hypothetical protein
MLQNSSQDPWAAVVNLVFEFLGSATVLKQEKAGLGFLNPDTEVKPVLSLYILPLHF